MQTSNADLFLASWTERHLTGLSAFDVCKRQSRQRLQSGESRDYTRAVDFSSLLRLFLPRNCPSCRRPLGEAAGVCSSCLEGWPAQITDASMLRETRIPHLIFLGEYRGGLRRTLAAFKYAGSREVANTLAGPLAARIPGWWALESVVSVPLHPRKQRKRGFNQAEVLAREVAKARGLPFLDTLERTRNTKQQAGLHGREREQNVRAAFKVRSNLTGSVSRSVLLVDDVFTTGSTLKECEQALLEAGVKQVYFMVVAR